MRPIDWTPEIDGQLLQLLSETPEDRPRMFPAKPRRATQVELDYFEALRVVLAKQTGRDLTLADVRTRAGEHLAGLRTSESSNDSSRADYPRMHR